MEHLLTVKEVAKILSFSERQIYRWTRAGILGTHYGRSVRILPEEINKIRLSGLPSCIFINNSNPCTVIPRISRKKKGRYEWQK